MADEKPVETKEETPVLPESPAEGLKQKGNEAFIAKNYKEAIEHYSAAIKEDPNNAVYYANRSACYSALKLWQKALEDALVSISKDPKYIKGYYRLSSAQTELQLFDDAETTLKAALTLEPGSEVIMRQLKALKTKRAAASTAANQKKPAKKLDEAQIKELMELQEQTNGYGRDLRTVKLRLSASQREARVNAVTSNHIQTLDPSVPLYRSVGKAFVFADRQEIDERLEKEIGEITKSQRDLTDRQEYLERRIASNSTNMQDLLKE